VIRETYYPESNTTETIAIYVSPKTKVLRAKISLPRKALHGKRTDAPPKASQATTTPLTRQRLSARNVFFRVVVAAAISVAKTGLIVGVFAWLLGRFAEIGVSMNPTLNNTVLT
jgi:hypothetical protein